MNLYDRIKPGKRRRGWGGAVFLAAACVVLVICIGTIGWAAQINRHNRLLASGSREEVSPLRVSAAPILPAFSTLAAKSVENLR